MRSLCEAHAASGKSWIRLLEKRGGQQCIKMCVATGRTEADIVGTELEASQSFVCLYESEQVTVQSKTQHNCKLPMCQRMQ